MTQEVTKFSRFYASFNKLAYRGDREEFKKSIVLQYTCKRTDSLREMTRKEYNTCCDALEKLTGKDEWRQKMREELRYRRSVCLKLMQKLGIDTSDWARINDSAEELEQLAVKLRSIQRKGGLREKQEQKVKPAVGIGYVLIDPNAPKC